MPAKVFFQMNHPLLLALFVLVGGATAVLLCSPYYLFSPLPALGLMVVLFLERRPQFGFYLILFSIPIDQYRALSEEYPSLTLSKGVGILLVLILLFKVVVQRRKLSLNSPLWPPLAIFLVANLLALLFTRFPATALNDVRQIITALIFFAIALVLIRREAFFGVVPKIIVTSVSLGALLSLYGYFFNDPLFAMHVDAGSLKRGIGASNDPNLFSLSLLFAMPLLAHYALNSRGLWRLMPAGLFALNMLALVLTFSRGGALNFALLLVFLLWEHKRYLRPKHLGLLLSGTLAAVMLTLLLIPSSYWERQKTVTDISDNSISRRIDYIVVARDAFFDNPLLGSGPGTFMDLWEEAVLTGQMDKGSGRSYGRPAHNTYLEILVGSGLLGLLPYLAVIVLALRGFLRAQRQFSEQEDENAASLVGAFKLSFISILFYFLILSTFYHKFFWLSLAFSQLVCRYADRREET